MRYFPLNLTVTFPFYPLSIIYPHAMRFAFSVTSWCAERNTLLLGSGTQFNVKREPSTPIKKYRELPICRCVWSMTDLCITATLIFRLESLLLNYTLKPIYFLPPSKSSTSRTLTFLPLLHWCDGSTTANNGRSNLLHEGRWVSLADVSCNIDHVRVGADGWPVYNSNTAAMVSIQRTMVCFCWIIISRWFSSKPLRCTWERYILPDKGIFPH